MSMNGLTWLWYGFAIPHSIIPAVWDALCELRRVRREREEVSSLMGVRRRQLGTPGHAPTTRDPADDSKSPMTQANVDYEREIPL